MAPRKSNLYKIITVALLVAVLVAMVVFTCACNAHGDENDDGDGNENIVVYDPNDGGAGEVANKGEEETTDMNKNPVATFIIHAQSGEDLTIRIELFPDKAPISVDNFTKLANSGYYDGLTFHRVVPNGCIQGGGYKITETDKGLVLDEPTKVPSIKGEFASNGWSKNDIKHELGVISMARTYIPDSATSQFFICVDSYPSWDGEYAAFGKATDKESLDNIIKLGSSKYVWAGEAFQTFPYPLVYIVNVRVE